MNEQWGLAIQEMQRKYLFITSSIKWDVALDYTFASWLESS